MVECACDQSCNRAWPKMYRAQKMVAAPWRWILIRRHPNFFIDGESALAPGEQPRARHVCRPGIPGCLRPQPPQCPPVYDQENVQLMCPVRNEAGIHQYGFAGQGEPGVFAQQSARKRKISPSCQNV